MKATAIRASDVSAFTLDGRAVHGSSALLVEDSRSLLFVSGQTPHVDGVLPEGLDLEGQVRQTIENLAAVLAAAGGDLTNVVKLNAWVTKREHIATYASVRQDYFVADPAPASTTVIGELVDQRMLIEIEAVAAF